MMTNLIKRKYDLKGNYFYNPGAEISESFYLERTMDLEANSFFASNPIKSLREHLYILDKKHF